MVKSIVSRFFANGKFTSKCTPKTNALGTNAPPFCGALFDTRSSSHRFKNPGACCCAVSSAYSAEKWVPNITSSLEDQRVFWNTLACNNSDTHTRHNASFNRSGHHTPAGATYGFGYTFQRHVQFLTQLELFVARHRFIQDKRWVHRLDKSIRCPI
uniref:Uncharacterized protein n=1 Tax=Hyaloperonospora arabidopsidis (strain Emoy2) TaxID=559515 RepID=M4BP11_HYAAE